MIVSADAKETDFDILIVSNLQADCDWICQSVDRSGEWRCKWVRTGYEMLDLVRRHAVPVVICRKDLPDSNWKSILVTLQEFHLPPSVIVLNDREDIDLWTEVLNQGGFDTLHRGLSREPIIHTIRQAFRRWKRRQEVMDARKKNVEAARVQSQHVMRSA